MRRLLTLLLVALVLSLGTAACVPPPGYCEGLQDRAEFYENAYLAAEGNDALQQDLVNQITMIYNNGEATGCWVLQP